MDTTRPADTDADAHRAQLDAYRRMTPGARVRAALELSALARRLVEDGVRARHPTYTAEQVRLAAIQAWLGPELFREAYGAAREVAP